jgi:hypothetical protein
MDPKDLKMSFDTITFIIWVCFLPIWLVWELYVLKDGEKTISQVARQRGWQLSSVVFFWTSMPVHWWLPVPWSGSTAGTVIFWAIIGALLIWNVATWTKTSRKLAFWEPWRLWFNWPMFYVIAGPLAAALLFPQHQSTPWSP